MEPVTDNVTTKRMAAVEALCQPLKSLVPYCRIECDDNLMSSVWIHGSYDPKETWSYGIYQNSNYFQFSITPAKGQRYYNGGDVTVEYCSGSVRRKFRKYTASPEKVVAKIKDWMTSV